MIIKARRGSATERNERNVIVPEAHTHPFSFDPAARSFRSKSFGFPVNVARCSSRVEMISSLYFVPVNHFIFYPAIVARLDRFDFL